MLRLLSTIIWLCSLGIGALWLTHYSTAPGLSDRKVSSWPTSSSIEKDAGEELLLVYLHPHCPCSHATVAELSKLRVRFPDLPICVCYFCPRNANADWSHGRLHDFAKTLSDRAPEYDAGGVEAERFGVLTSGHVMLFDESGKLRYSGGVTSGRGHEGNNPGLNRLCEALANSLEDNKVQGVAGFPVFGCAIRKGAK